MMRQLREHGKVLETGVRGRAPAFDSQQGPEPRQVIDCILENFGIRAPADFREKPKSREFLFGGSPLRLARALGVPERAADGAVDGRGPGMGDSPEPGLGLYINCHGQVWISQDIVSVFS